MNTIDPKMPVSQILHQYPETISVFRDFGMRCADDSSYAAKTLEENFMTEKVNFMDLLGRLNKAVNPPAVMQAEPSPVEQKIMATKKAMQVTREARERKRAPSSLTAQEHVPEDATGLLIAIYVFAVLGGWLGAVLGMYVFNRQIKLSDGQSVHKYKDSHRSAAIGGAILSGVVMIVLGLITLLFD